MFFFRMQLHHILITVKYSIICSDGMHIHLSCDSNEKFTADFNYVYNYFKKWTLISEEEEPVL